LVRAAALIAGITVLARLVGFARTVVFGRTVGSGCVGAVYQTANTIPNIVFDIVAGGVLSALVVPLLAPLLAGPDRAAASRAVSALLTWAVLVLVPAAALIALLARPLIDLLLGHDSCAGATSLGTRMLVVFAPQVLFYGLGVVLGGVLQAAERFTWPALAPLLSSLTVIAAYLWYGALTGVGQDAVPRNVELVLSLGTTAGVIVLAASQLPGLRHLGLRLRPTLRFPTGLAPTARRAALAGVLTLGSQQLSSAVMIRLANQGTATGTVVIVTLAQTVFLLPWAVLGVPVATSTFPRLAMLRDADRVSDARRLAMSSARVIGALSAVGTAVLVAAAQPTANILLPAGSPSRAQLAPTIAAFAVGLIGWSLVALLARSLYAAQAMLPAARAQVIGQLLIVVADIVLSVLAPTHYRAVWLALGNAAGVWVTVALLVRVGHRVGMLDRPATISALVVRAGLAGAIGAAGGWAIGRLAAGHSAVSSVGFAVAAAIVATALAVAVLTLIDRDVVLLVWRRVRPAAAS
jgi:putative peptidoglycan lipid II flippase